MEKVVITNERISDLVSNSYRVARQHGFHDDYHSPSHYMMLVLSEIGEMVEADRKNRHADIACFKTNCTESWTTHFETCIKDTFEDEMADVVIRLCDFCGSLNVLPQMNDVMVDMSDEFAKFFGDKSICEQCFALSSMVVDVERASYDADDSEMRKRLGGTLTVRWNTTNRVRVDTERHINNLKYKNIIVVMAQMENKSKVFVEKLGSWVANKRSIERVEVDLSRVVAIGEPMCNDNSVNMYFENAIWRISKRSYDEIISLWRDL